MGVHFKSFVIKKEHLIKPQILMILNYKDHTSNEMDQDWEVYESEDEVRGSTIVDNFDFEEF